MSIARRILSFTIRLLFNICKAFPTKRNTIVFESFLGKQYSDNPKAIHNYLKEHYPEYKLYWSFDRRYFYSFKKNVKRPLRRFGFKWVLVLARAEFLITNSRMPHWIPKRKGTTYIQTWHGTPLKKLGVDIAEVHMPGTTTEKYKENFTNEAKKWDVLISPNPYSTEIFKRAFQYNGKIIESGYPRNDILYTHNNTNTITEIKNKLNLPLGKKILLYAPTWRDNDFYAIGRYKLNLKLDLQQLKDQLGDTYIILIRAHYLVAEHLDLSAYNQFAYDVSLYPDINELYLISDILITDYSSVFFDYANLKRPMLFFTYDIQEYRDHLRGFYFDFEEEAPGPLIQTTTNLISEIKAIETNGYELNERLFDFYGRFCSLEDGEASERVVREIFFK